MGGFYGVEDVKKGTLIGRNIIGTDLRSETIASAAHGCELPDVREIGILGPGEADVETVIKLDLRADGRSQSPIERASVGRVLEAHVGEPLWIKIVIL